MTDRDDRLSHRPALPPDPPGRSRPVPVRLAHPAHAARARRGKPEANGVRMALGLAGLASASALATAMLPTILPQPAAAAGTDTAVVDAATPEPSVITVTRVVQLAPGETLPPDAANAGSVTAPASTPQPKPTAKPTPRIIYQTVTRQSGKP